MGWIRHFSKAHERVWVVYLHERVGLGVIVLPGEAWVRLQKLSD